MLLVEFADSNIMHGWEHPEATQCVSACVWAIGYLISEDDEQVTSAASWSLSQIGGEEARLYLQYLLDQAEDEDQIEFLEDALDNLAFTDDLEGFDLMSCEPEDEDER